MEWLSEIRKLRKNVPVGIQVARRLLERTGGDVDEAIKLFHIDQINILTAKADVTHQEAENVLLATNYDIAEALRRIDEQRYTLTELILRKNKDAGDALNNIALAIEYEWDLKRRFWFGFADIQLLPPVLQTFMLVYEWHEYVGWEGMECGIFFESDHTHQQLQALGLLELAQKMVTARIRYDELKDKAENFHEITEDDIFKMLIIHCDQLAREVDSILLQFVKDNIDVFPCRHNRHEL
ncbi:protein YfbN [Escherichia sp. 584]|uniref:protein YfbN n=1 Tax=Escherichia sp. 584 TaxID=3435634 RepID=UPI003F673E97